ncbi:MAG TPA: 4-hydroxybenzoate octaprenyltransferase [Gemmatimonadales bacterium]|nr:4-hydroxybenzoate octaprenyltransferase [Gemmatimonadales bacterium]
MRKTRPWSADLKPVADADPDRGLPHAAREGQTFAGDRWLVRYANFVRLPHTVFALPFALLGVVYASRAHTVRVVDGLLVVVAFTAARFVAMGFNRIVDRHQDARNPRTSGRELPAGRLTLRHAWVAVAAAAVVFVVSAALLNPLCLLLSPVALAWVCLYSFTKRWTDWSHAWLGASLAIAPVGGFLAIAGQWSQPAWPLLALAGAVGVWVAGFDVFYALQDEVFDRVEGLRSAVVRLGQARAIYLAKVAHWMAVGLLLLFGWGAGWSWPYYGAVILAAGLLVWEHRLVAPGNLSRLDAAFFTVNGVISVVVLLGAVAERLL